MRRPLALPALVLALIMLDPRAAAACGDACASQGVAGTRLAAAYPREKPAVPRRAAGLQHLPVGHFSAPGVESRTGSVVLRRDVVVTAAETFMNDRKWRAPLHLYRFFLDSDGAGAGKPKAYQIAYLVLGTARPQRNPGSDWAVVKLVEAVDARVEPLQVRRVGTSALGSNRRSLLQLAYITPGAPQPALGACRLAGAAAGSAGAGAVYHDCVTETDVSGAPLIVEDGGTLYLGLLHVDRAWHERRVAGGAAHSGRPVYNLGIRVDGDLYRRIVAYASR